MDPSELTILRRAYARHIAFAARADDPRLEAALLNVRREAFMGEGPWLIGAAGGPNRTPDAEPHWLYDVVQFDGSWLTPAIRFLAVVALVWLCVSGRWGWRSRSVASSGRLPELLPVT